MVLLTSLGGRRPDSPSNPLCSRFAGKDGKAELVWYVDYTFEYSTRVRSIMLEAVQSLDGNGAVAAMRQAPAATSSHTRDMVARAAVAAGWQGQYLTMHRALIGHEGEYDEQALRDLARRSTGLPLLIGLD